MTGHLGPWALAGACAAAIIACAGCAAPAPSPRAANFEPPAHLHYAPPALVNKVKPDYSAVVRRKHIDGQVVVCFAITPDGRPRNPRLEAASSSAARRHLGGAAVRAVSQWEFRPRVAAGEYVLTLGACRTLKYPPPGFARGDIAQRAAPAVKLRYLPYYPVEAREKGIQGRLEVCFTVTAAGSVSHASVESASSGPVRKHLGGAAVRSISGWKFFPRVVDGKPVATPGVCQPVNYRAGARDRPIGLKVKVRPRYPYLARRRHVTGAVRVCFTVEPDGSVSDPHVDSASSKKAANYFSQSAVRTIAHWKFYPKIVKGKPVVAHACRTLTYP